MSFIIFVIILSVIIAIVKAIKNEKQNKKKVEKFYPTSAPYTVYHVSGLPIAEEVQLFLYDCGSRILLSNAGNDITISKSKITGVDFAAAKGFNIQWVLTIHYNSDGILKTVALKGGAELEKMKNILDSSCGSNHSIDL
nr:hypothetical protein [Treponema sp.]